MRAAALACVWCAACTAVQSPTPPHTSDAVLAGVADTRDTNVFLLYVTYDTGTSVECSSVLISPKVLLTAAHCLDPAMGGATSLTAKAMNKPDTSAVASTDFIDLVQTALHPQWNMTAGVSTDDLALGLLARAPTQVTPALLQVTPPATWVGETARVVGYGRTASTATDTGTRREAAVTVVAEAAATLELGVAGVSGVCAGDSGGPSLWRGPDGLERVAGIHSATLSSSCGDGLDVRVDAHRLDFIVPWVAANDPPLCSADGRCAANCTAPDVDCVCIADGVCNGQCPDPLIDPDCPHDCGADGVCSAGPCPAPDPDCSCLGDGVCQVSCPVGRADPDCPNCGADGVCSLVPCPTDDVDCAVDGDPCTDGSTCLKHLCVADPRGFTVCSRACAADTDCVRGMSCTRGQCGAVVTTPGGTVKGGCAQAPTPALLWAALALALFRRARSR